MKSKRYSLVIFLVPGNHSDQSDVEESDSQEDLYLSIPTDVLIFWIIPPCVFSLTACFTSQSVPVLPLLNDPYLLSVNLTLISNFLC